MSLRASELTAEFQRIPCRSINSPNDSIFLALTRVTNWSPQIAGEKFITTTGVENRQKCGLISYVFEKESISSIYSDRKQGPSS